MIKYIFEWLEVSLESMFRKEARRIDRNSIILQIILLIVYALRRKTI